MVAIEREFGQEFTQLEQAHRSSDVVDVAVLLRHLISYYGFPPKAQSPLCSGDTPCNVLSFVAVSF